MSQPYRIAIIAGQLVLGGAERQLYLWLSHLNRGKFEPVVLTLHPGHDDHWERYIEALGIPLIRIRHRSSRLMRLLDMIKALRPYKPQLIHGWHIFASPYAGFAARILGARSIGGVRSAFHTFDGRTFVSRLACWIVDAILANSGTVADEIRTLGTKKPVFCVQNAVEAQSQDRTAMRQKIAGQFGFSVDNQWIGMIGRMDPKKHFDHLLRVVGLFGKERTDFHCLIIGDGPERANLEKLTDELSIRQSVAFAGEVPDAGAWLSAFDIFCFTSLSEGQPNAVMEAAAAGLPVAAWRVPFMQELLKDGDEACLVEPCDLEGMKTVIVELMHSPDLRKKLGTAAQRRILEEFSLERYVREMARVYEAVLGPESPHTDRKL